MRTKTLGSATGKVAYRKKILSVTTSNWGQEKVRKVPKQGKYYQTSQGHKP